MEREPTQYSRLLVILGLFPLLALDLAVGLPGNGFVVGASVVFAVAAGIHFRGGEPRAAAGWLTFGGALAVVAFVEVTESTLYLVAFGLLLVAGLLLLASERASSLDDGE